MSFRRPVGARWFLWAVLLGSVLSACSRSPEPRSPLQPTQVQGAFVWPLSGWITATDTYWTGKPHTLGTADITAPYWQPVGAARAGTVTEATWSRSPRLGFYVKLDHGGGYETLYAHLVDAPKVTVGERVKRNQVLGYNGRTGNAGLPHVHFAILQNGAALPVPGLEFGAWATRGALIPGDYPGLSTASSGPVTFVVKAVVDELLVKRLPTLESRTLGTLKRGTLLRVSGAEDGFYRFTHDGTTGYVVSSGTAPAVSRLFGVRTVAETAVYAGPEAGAPTLATLPAGTVLSAFGRENGRYKVQWRDPGSFVHYVWVPEAAAVRTGAFWVCGALSPALSVRSGPGLDHPVVQTLRFTPYRPAHLVSENVQGWYRIGPDRWVPGWRTVRW